MAEDYTPASPVRDPDNAPFYDALKEGKLLIKQCNACNERFFYPRALCPFCLSESSWVESSGKGTIYSYSQVATRVSNYMLALVTLAEGPTMLSNIVTDSPNDLAIDQAVEVQFLDTAGAEKLPVFAPG